MRLVVQRVSKAKVMIGGDCYSAIGRGFLVLLGIETEDNTEDVTWLTAKLCGMRVFADEAGKMNLDLSQADGEVMVVSQFTLHASTKKGNRPSFTKAARPETAIPLYREFIRQMDKTLGKPCATGEFGADMQVELINDGPVTIILDSKNKE
ncbi:MAG TPA: D-aminoacyl-tRNA deacylase [Bacteroidia bacterium]|nr:D-aminoacyl-tRNA deacylase [Bacteroidia bacterium]